MGRFIESVKSFVMIHKIQRHSAKSRISRIARTFIFREIRDSIQHHVNLHIITTHTLLFAQYHAVHETKFAENGTVFSYSKPPKMHLSSLRFETPWKYGQDDLLQVS